MKSKSARLLATTEVRIAWLRNGASSRVAPTASVTPISECVRLSIGEPGGHLAEAFAAFTLRDPARRVFERRQVPREVGHPDRRREETEERLVVRRVADEEPLVKASGKPLCPGRARLHPGLEPALLVIVAEPGVDVDR